MVLCEFLRNDHEAGKVWERISSSLARSYELTQGRALVTVSIGLALPRRGEDPEAVLARADAAMYDLKARRVGRHRRE